MDAIMNHLDAFRGLYIVLAVVALGAGGLFGFDALTLTTPGSSIRTIRGKE